MKIMVICGSARANANSRGLARAAETLMIGKNVDVSYFDVGLNMLPIYTGDELQREHPEVKRLMAYAEQANGFFIVTPEYHSGMSGALKNALDFLGGKYFRGKPVSLVAAGGGGKGGINALNSLRVVIRGIYGLALPDQLVADPFCFNEDCEFVHVDMKKRLEQITGELVHMTGLLAKTEEGIPIKT